MLVITAKKQSPVELGWKANDFRGENKLRVHAGLFNYTSSSITSKGKKSFFLGGRGKVEIRAKVDVRSGGFPASHTSGRSVQWRFPGSHQTAHWPPRHWDRKRGKLQSSKL